MNANIYCNGQFASRQPSALSKRSFTAKGAKDAKGIGYSVAEFLHCLAFAVAVKGLDGGLDRATAQKNAQVEIKSSLQPLCDLRVLCGKAFI